MTWFWSTLERAQATKPWRVWNRYGQARGNVLAGGMAYTGFFSLFPALALGFAVIGLVAGDSADLQLSIARRVNEIIGTTVIGTRPGEGVVGVDRLVEGKVLTWAGVAGLVVLLLSGLGWVDAVRQGVRAVCGLPDEGNPVVSKLVDVVLLTVLGLATLLSAVATVSLSAASSSVLDWLGLADSAPVRVLVAASFDVVLIVTDGLLLAFLVRAVSHVRLAWQDLLAAVAIGAVGLFALKVGGGLLLAQATRNRWFAAFSVVIGLLLWFNLASRIVLLAASWAATSAADHGRPVAPQTEQDEPDQHDDEDDGAGRGPQVPAAVVVAQRDADRVSVLAGAVLGAGAVAVLGAVRNGAAALTGRDRSDRADRSDPTRS